MGCSCSYFHFGGYWACLCAHAMHGMFSGSAVCAAFAANRLQAPPTVPRSPPRDLNPAHALAPTPFPHPPPPSHQPTRSTQYDAYMTLHTHSRTASTRVYMLGSTGGHGAPPSTSIQ